MDELVGRAPRVPAGRAKTAVIASVITALVVGAAAYLIGHEVGVRAGTAPSAQFIHGEQAARISVVRREVPRLIHIEQLAADLLMGRRGPQVNLAAVVALRQRYIDAENALFAQRGTVTSLFSTTVKHDAAELLSDNVSAQKVLWQHPGQLTSMTAGEIGALLSNSHVARKHQWADLAAFMQDATSEMNNP